MNKITIKLVLLLVLGIAFQAQAMNENNMNPLTDEEMVNEIVEYLEQKEKDAIEQKRIEAEKQERKKKDDEQIKEWKRQKKKIDDKCKEQFANLIIAVSSCAYFGVKDQDIDDDEELRKTYKKKSKSWWIPFNFNKNITMTPNECVLKLQEIFSSGFIDVYSIIDEGRTLSLIASCIHSMPVKFFTILLDNGVYFCNWGIINSNYYHSPLGIISKKNDNNNNIYDVSKPKKNKFLKLFLAHNYSLLPSELKNNNNILISNAYQIDAIKNSPDTLAQKLVECDEKYLLQRVLIKIKSPNELKSFANELQNEVEKKFKIILKTQDFQESLIEQYATPAIMYQLMINGVVPITEKRIMAQPSKKRQLELQDHLDQNKMITFNQNFDSKLNYKLITK